MYRMTYNHTGVTGCSARGIAKRETKEELLVLAEELKGSICNVHIEKISDDQQQHLPLEIFANMKELR
ncbi:MAG: hypothetical protein PHW18_00365 [Sulfuricurvum sp.]|uniref:hypothetical protein n=1 Tax=Sulfuricurvum sp. TaxID=2025608 RepID=UPI00261D016D|nr:hypothetical protein [Sulfuricurvum sp.]MDD2828008.1 hypothetical protein [Sulfuricurvum sp.]MDD4948115.1 hypothetical protein [Sulfuricurvum sp.]